MRLDFLQNYPLNPKANAILTSSIYPNLSALSPAEMSAFNQKSLEFASIFGGNIALPFGFGCSDYLALFSQISSKIAYATSNHQQAHTAVKMLKNQPFKLTPNPKSGKIELSTIDEAIKENCDCFIIPFVNQDILSINDIIAIKERLQKRLKDFTFIVDISYAQSSQIPIPNILDTHTIFLLNSESIGLLRGNGIIIAKDFSTPSIFPQNLANVKLFDAALEAVKNPVIKLSSIADSKIIFYNKLKDILKEDLSLFAPLENTLPNALPLRFRSIKARVFLQSLLIAKIYAINGQECLFGFSKPSFVLQEMGYSQTQSRELISISYINLEDEGMIALIKTLAHTYRQILTIGV